MKKTMAAAALVLAAVLVYAPGAGAQIGDPAEYLGEWYINYMKEGPDGAQMNVASLMGASYTLQLEEDGTGQAKITPLQTEESGDEAEEEETMTLTWTFDDGKIQVTGEDDSAMIIDEVDGEVLGDAGDNTYFVLGRELIQEDTDWDALLGDMSDKEHQEAAKTARENPYVYKSEADNTAEVIAAYLKKNSYGNDYEVTLDPAGGTFTADWPGNEYADPEHIEGTYEITADNFVNIKWTDEKYGFENSYEGAEYVQLWDDLTLKEDLSNLSGVVAKMAGMMDYEHTYTPDSVTLAQDGETEGTATLRDGDYEFTYQYRIYPGADPYLILTYHDEANDTNPEWNNYSLRQ